MLFPHSWCNHVLVFATMGWCLVKRPRATGVFIIGFWLLDLANNTMQSFTEEVPLVSNSRHVEDACSSMSKRSWWRCKLSD
ncbi:hypothetical protein GOP47_0009408 [Adiantum capillus-veneris]|uniref:Uncharacterized protein n=1 Tax=Adiantum capillus-veneris TaxID=13818 RepID=A0A9D4UX18_ADICA|nr:hypothetical protein GOP47_0009408 [Adiantum capillus-veneris]